MAESPDIDNLTIPSGIVSIKIDGVDTVYRDMGEVSDFTFDRTSDKKQYDSKRSGLATTVKEVVVKTTASVKWTANEITPENLAIFAGGTVDTDTAGNSIIYGGTDVNKTGTIKFAGTTDIGNPVSFEATISITPNGSLAMLAADNDWMEIPLEATVTRDADGKFEKWTFAGAVTS